VVFLSKLRLQDSPPPPTLSPILPLHPTDSSNIFHTAEAEWDYFLSKFRVLDSWLGRGAFQLFEAVLTLELSRSTAPGTPPPPSPNSTSPPPKRTSEQPDLSGGIAGYVSQGNCAECCAIPSTHRLPQLTSIRLLRYLWAGSLLSGVFCPWEERTCAPLRRGGISA